MEREIDDIYISEDLVDSKIYDDGIYRQSKVLNDIQYMESNNLPIPQQEDRSKYYAIERNGIMYHVFNAERYVNFFIIKLFKILFTVSLSLLF